MSPDHELIANDAVSVELGPGTFSFHWPAVAVRLGRCRATAVVDGAELDADDVGTWHREPGWGAGRAGTWVRWIGDRHGPTVAIHVPMEGPVVVVMAELVVARPGHLDRITPLVGSADLRWQRRLVDGYDSWAYSGVRDDEGASFWNTAYVSDDGRALVVQALAAERLCTRITNTAATVRVDCGAVPSLRKVSGTWGYVVDEPLGLQLPVRAGESVVGEPIALAAGRDARVLVEELAGLAGDSMHARRWTGAAPNGWESWYHYGLFLSAGDVLANARTLRERFASRHDLDLVQIDDGWQRTYGAWWPNERFPDDLGEIVRDLEALGCRAGLWVAPFRVQPDAPGVASEHPEWCIGDGAGAPLHEDRNGTWALDASHPGAEAWLRELGAQVRSWGFEMVKVDFCYLGALSGARHDPRVTGIEAMNRGLRALVDGLGDDVYVLGCGIPVLPAVGICHGSRVGHDLAMPRLLQEIGHPVDDGWTGFAGVRAQARNVVARWAHAGRWYDVDPEVVMAWGSDGADPAGYGTEEARTIATMVALCSGPFLLADELASLAPAERAVLEQGVVEELVGAGAFRPVDVFVTPDPSSVPEHAFSQGPGIAGTWIAERGGRPVVAVFNWSDRPSRFPVPPAFAGTVELWTGERAGNKIDVPAHGVRVLGTRGPVGRQPTRPL